MVETLRSVVDHVFGAEKDALGFEEVAPNAAAHVRAMQAVTAPWSRPVDRAFLAGFGSDRIGTAFAAGYTEALRALLPDPVTLAAFAVTEREGGAPRAMHTTLTWRADGSAVVSGEKTFVTLGRSAERVYVVVADGADDAGKNRLRLVRIAADAPGLGWFEGPALPIVPEVTHARLELRDVPVPATDVLPGDAYVHYVKPFRTIEDLHVHAALCGHLLRMARAFDLPLVLQAELVSAFGAVRALAAEPPLDRATHLALGGALAAFEHLLGAHAEALRTLPEGVRSRFERDVGLRFVAAKARARRLEVAFSR